MDLRRYLGLGRAAALFGALALVASVACSGGKSSGSTPTTTAPAGTLTPAGQAIAVPAIRPEQGLTTVEIVQKLAPSIVRVQTEGATLNFFGQAVPNNGVGTGFVIDADGHIVTNDHVITTNGRVASRITVTLADGSSDQAQIVGRDEATDLAVLKVSKTGLTPAVFGDSSKVQVGQDVVAIGYALDLKGGPTVTRGVISATGRTIQEQTVSINDAFQTDASINPGNSGGPLVDANGEVIAIDTAVASNAQGIGFAIAAEQVQPIIQELIAKGSVSRAYIGLASVDVTPSIAQNFGLGVDHGTGITQVAPDSPAAQAGLQPGDVIVKADDQDINNSGDLFSFLAKHKAGDKVRLQVYRGNSQRSIDVTLGGSPQG